MPKSAGAWVRMPIWIERSGIDDAFLHRAGHERAVVDALAVVVPRVLVGIELHQRQRPVDRRMRLEQRPGDEMIAAQRQQKGAGVEQSGSPRARSWPASSDGCRCRAGSRHSRPRRACSNRSRVKRILRIVVEDRRGAPDRLRSEAGARPVGHGRVEGDAPDHGVGTLHVLRVFAPHEGERAGIGRLVRGAHLAAAVKAWSMFLFGMKRSPVHRRDLIGHNLQKCDPSEGRGRLKSVTNSCLSRPCSGEPHRWHGNFGSKHEYNRR